MKEAFIETHIPSVKNVPVILHSNNDLTEKLANMNDDGKSFKKIANWIEKNL